MVDGVKKEAPHPSSNYKSTVGVVAVVDVTAMADVTHAVDARFSGCRRVSPGVFGNLLGTAYARPRDVS